MYISAFWIFVILFVIYLALNSIDDKFSSLQSDLDDSRSGRPTGRELRELNEACFGSSNTNNEAPKKLTFMEEINKEIEDDKKELEERKLLAKANSHIGENVF